MNMSRYKLILEYNGANLIGWQENAQGASVQSALQDAIFGFSGQRAEVVAAGRTDAGVHAIGMAAHFDLENEASPALAAGPQSASAATRDAGAGQIHHRLQKQNIKNLATQMRNSMTRQEKKFWYSINAKKLGFSFRRQFNIDNKYIADFVCLEKHLIVEIDGSQHYENKKDEIRTEYLQRFGFNVVRFWNWDIDNNLNACLEIIHDILTNDSFEKRKSEFEKNLPNMRVDGNGNIILPAPASRVAALALCGPAARAGRGDRFSADTVMRAINFYLRQMGAPVAVLDCEVAAPDFHARFSCKRRNYRYVILNRRSPVILDNGMVWWIPRPLDIGKMRAAAAKLLGPHDWTSFRSSECQAKSPVKTLDRADCDTCDMAFGAAGEMQGQYVIMNFSAKSFLHHQVRNIVGTLVEIGLGKDYDIDEIFARRARAAAGPTAPPHGLYFVSAEY